MSLPKDRDSRNALPVWDGFIAYFPDVPAEVAKVSVLGNRQHNLGAKLHWNTHVSTDHKNKVLRHMIDDEEDPMDDDGTFHMAKAVWRASAVLQIRCWQRDGKNEHGEKIAALQAEIDAEDLAELNRRRTAVCIMPSPSPYPDAPTGAQESIDELGPRGFDGQR